MSCPSQLESISQVPVPRKGGTDTLPDRETTMEDIRVCFKNFLLLSDLQVFLITEMPKKNLLQQRFSIK